MINKDLKAHLKSVGAFACIVALMASSAITPVSVAHANEPDTIIETGEEQKSSEIIDCGEFNGLNWAINTDRLLTITGVYSGEKGSDESFPWYFSSRDVSYVLLDCELNGDVSDLLEGIKFGLYSVEFGPNFDTTGVTDMNQMFGWCANLSKLDCSGFDTSNVVNMSGMFEGCGELDLLDISGFDMSSVQNKEGILRNSTPARINFPDSGFTGADLPVIVNTTHDGVTYYYGSDTELPQKYSNLKNSPFKEASPDTELSGWYAKLIDARVEAFLGNYPEEYENGAYDERGRYVYDYNGPANTFNHWTVWVPEYCSSDVSLNPEFPIETLFDLGIPKDLKPFVTEEYTWTFTGKFTKFPTILTKFWDNTGDEPVDTLKVEELGYDHYTGPAHYIMLFERTENPKPTPIPTATPEPTATPIPSATPEPTATPEPEPTATPVPVPTDIPTPSPKPLPTVTPEPLPETPEEPEVLQDNVNTLLPGTVAALGTGTGFICLLFLYFRRKKVFHGVYDEAVNSKNKDYTDMDNWYVPTLAEKVKTGQLTAGEFIETVRNCKYKSKFPSDTKVSLILDGETITSNATEKDLFKALTENNQIPVSIAFSSKKTGLNLTITFRE